MSASKKRSALAARRGPLELADDFRKQADALVAGVTGVGPAVDVRWSLAVHDADAGVALIDPETAAELYDAEEHAREVVAASLLAQGADPRLYRAVVAPDAKPPAATLRDAVNLYLREKLGGDDADKKDTQRVERVFARIAKAVGPLDKLALVDLRHKHGPTVVDHFLQERTKTKALLSVASIKREMNIAKAVVNYAIRGFDLENTAKNPFAKLAIVRRGEAAPIADNEKREQLPAAVIKAMSEGLRKDDLRLIWRLLAGSGCRLAEVTGLTLEDVDLAANIPHIRVRWHEDRRLKTVVSIRSVPLVGDALDAAREAMKLPRTGKAVFERYGRKGGPSAVSQALMNYLRPLSSNPKHVVHSLRHNMRARLELAKVPEVVMNLILGHSLGGVGARVYGSDRLPLTEEALLAAAKVRVQ